MDERFLHHIWKFQKLNGKLQTIDGQELIVLNQGNHNHNSGPDFEEARIKLGKIEWAGKIEIHIKSSDWLAHNHHLDKAYESVILHVVWKHDRAICINNEPIPTLELCGLVNQNEPKKYLSFIDQRKDILCQDQLPSVSSLTFTNQLDRMMIERLEQKAVEILDLTQSQNADWESITYLSLAKNFGFAVNKEPFLTLALSLPYKVFAKNTSGLGAEALVFGQSGFLNEKDDAYRQELQREYVFLKSKYGLTSRLEKQMWKFGRMRPSNFPTVRLAQFAALIKKNKHLFSTLIEIENPKDVVKLLDFNVGDYWMLHYDFGKVRKKPGGNLGKSTVENLIINTIAPLFAAYSKYTGNQSYIDKAILILEVLSAESNQITKKWSAAGQEVKSAFDSQSLIGLYKNYCTAKRCLECGIGIEILDK
ncbi:MAG: DUF2851 family protein [Cyclobacteriaceae bacterium]